jgi:hypothetical protein
LKSLAALAALAVLVSCVTEAPLDVRQADQAWRRSRSRRACASRISRGQRHLALRLADAVGPGGVVYAVEVDPLRSFACASARRGGERRRDRGRNRRPAPARRERRPRAGRRHVRPAREPTSYFEHVSARAAPGGRVAIVEVTEPELFVPPPPTADGIVNQLAAAGFALAERRALLERRSLLVFTPSR